MSEDVRDEGLGALEAALAGLAPAPPALNRDLLLFRAGQESVPRRGRLWPWATGLLAATAACLGVALVLRPEPSAVERVVYIKEQTPPRPPAPVPPPDPAPAQRPDMPAVEAPDRVAAEAAQLRREMLRWGVDGLPLTPAAGDASGLEGDGKGLVQPPAVPTYHQLRTSLRTGDPL
jgi:hypothetical protein